MAVLTHAELLVTLGGRHAVARAVDCGQWVRVLRGVYTDGEVDLRVRAAAADRVLPATAVVSGRSALWLCGAEHVQDGRADLEVLVPRGVVLPRRTGLSAREGLVEPRDLGAVGGLPCLRASRAALDVARRELLPAAVGVLDATLHAGLAVPGQLVEELDRAFGLRGVQTARTAVALADGRAESPPESCVRIALVQGGLEPVPQHVVLDATGRFVARVDLALVHERIALEYDGRASHGTAEAFVRDRQRQNDLVALGWRVLRFTAEDLRDPYGVVLRVRALLAPRAA